MLFVLFQVAIAAVCLFLDILYAGVLFLTTSTLEVAYSLPRRDQIVDSCNTASVYCAICVPPPGL